jgi:signal transduction histidine kinase
MQQAAVTLAKLVDDLLDAVRSRTGKMRVNAHPMDFTRLVIEAIQAFRLSLEAKRITVHQDLAEAVMVLGDQTRLQQVVWNVISNAIRHNNVGGEIEVVLRTDGMEAILEIRDTGEGIDPALLPHVFEPFRQHDAGKGGGLGLGLAIARSLIEIHGGTIAAESEGRGKGATFRVRLPLLRT